MFISNLSVLKWIIPFGYSRFFFNINCDIKETFSKIFTQLNKRQKWTACLGNTILKAGGNKKQGVCWYRRDVMRSTASMVAALLPLEQRHHRLQLEQSRVRQERLSDRPRLRRQPGSNERQHCLRTRLATHDQRRHTLRIIHDWRMGEMLAPDQWAEVSTVIKKKSRLIFLVYKPCPNRLAGGFPTYCPLR